MNYSCHIYSRNDILLFTILKSSKKTVQRKKLLDFFDLNEYNDNITNISFIDGKVSATFSDGRYLIITKQKKGESVG